MRTSITLAAAILALFPGLAKAQEPPCLTRTEVAALAKFALPGIVSTAAKRCSAALPDDSFLLSHGERLAARYAQRKDESWPAAKSAFLKMGSGKNKQTATMLSNAPDEVFKPQLEILLSGLVAQEIPLKECETIDDVVRILSPLPADNMAELFTLLMDLGSKGKEPKPGKPRMCRI